MPRHFSFSGNLFSWYQKNARDLPWRRTKDPYKIWISEIMLQQTTVAAVIPYYKRWIKVFPTVRAVARAPLQKILKCWQGLGYYQRAKNIHQSAKVICDAHNGKVPHDPDTLKSLPGFGPYTTGAVLSIAFGQRWPIIDANVRRVVMRYLAIEGKADPSQDAGILKFLESVMPHKKINIFNQALMELGALVCLNRVPQCLKCPVRAHCQAYKKGVQEIIPAPRKVIIKDVEAVVAVIRKEGRFLIQKRSSRGLLADLWEFPGGKVERGESPRSALLREVKEELGTTVKSAEHIMNVRHFYTQFRVRLHVWSCDLDKYPAPSATCKWVRLKDFSRYPLPSGSAKIVERLS